MRKNSRYDFLSNESFLALCKKQREEIDRIYMRSNLEAHNNEVAVIKDIALKYCRGYGLDVGCSNHKLSGSIGVDLNRAANPDVLSPADCIPLEPEKCDYVFSSHCLEHMDNIEKTLLEWKRLLKKRGILFLYLPHEMSAFWSIRAMNGIHKWEFNHELLSYFLQTLDFSIKECVVMDDFFSFYIVAFKN